MRLFHNVDVFFIIILRRKGLSKDTDLLEGVLQMARRMIKGLELLSYEKSWDCSAQRRTRGVLPMCINTWWEGIKKEPGSS